MAQQGRLIPIPNLDDRDWHAIKDAMIQAIPDRCPEWTNWNVADPGITLIEVFAQGMEELIYRLNQVLRKHMLEYLNMIGVTLTPPSAARAMEFFKLSAPQPFDVIIPRGFEVAAAGADNKPVVFTTDEELTIHAAKLYRCLGFQEGQYTDYTDAANNATDEFNPLPKPLNQGDILYFAYQENNYFRKLNITIAVPAPGWFGGVWEYYQGLPDETFAWTKLAVEDNTENFKQSGAISFDLPADWEPININGITAVWLRYRISWVVAPGQEFAVLRQCTLEDIYGRAPISNALAIAEEVLGSSDATSDQRFYLANVPILDITIWVDEGAGFTAWTAVEDFSQSGESDEHYVINHGIGEIRFGNGVRGKIPAMGANNVKAAPYRCGGGVRGNVPARAINQLRSSQAYVDQCVNLEAAKGGGDEETLEQCLERGPREQLKTRNRAVTAEDFETLALESSTGIARAKALPLFDPARPEEETPGAVSIIVMPKQGKPLSLALRQAIREYLNRRRLVTARLHVIDPEYVAVDINVTLKKTDLASAGMLEQKVRKIIAEFLHPEFGGQAQAAIEYIEGRSQERGTGWPFGRHIYLSELYELLERIPGVDHAESIAAPIINVVIEKNQLPKCNAITVMVV